MRPLTKALIASGAVLVALTLAAAVFVVVDRSDDPDPRSLQVERADSHVLDPGDSDAVSIVEFLDFECEACAAYHPVVEDVREKYEGEIRFVVRYFPLPGHPNSGTAAVAAEAAAQQGRFEDMYRVLFERQTQWSHTTESRAPVFRGYAVELGLDMAAYDDAVADPATEARVRADFDEGRALGVSSTPTFFVNGEPLTIQRWGDLETAILDAQRD